MIVTILTAAKAPRLLAGDGQDGAFCEMELVVERIDNRGRWAVLLRGHEHHCD